MAHRHFAMLLSLKIDGSLGMSVWPHAFLRDLTRLSRALGGREVELAQETEFSDAFPDCELGALPPFGNLYDLPVYVDARLSEHTEIAFNAGSHTDLVRMPYAEFEPRAKPAPLWLAQGMSGLRLPSESLNCCQN